MVTRKEFQAHTLFRSATALLASEPSNILQMVIIVSPIEVEGAMLIPHGIYYSVFTLIRRIPLQKSGRRLHFAHQYRCWDYLNVVKSDPFVLSHEVKSFFRTKRNDTNCWLGSAMEFECCNFSLLARIDQSLFFSRSPYRSVQ